MYLVRAFFSPDQGTFLWILKKGRGDSPLLPNEETSETQPPPPLVTRLKTLWTIFSSYQMFYWTSFSKTHGVIFSYRKIFGQTSWLKECHGLHFRETKAQIIMLNIFSSFFQVLQAEKVRWVFCQVANNPFYLTASVFASNFSFCLKRSILTLTW